VRRVSVVGNSGSGKSTLGRALAERLEVPYVELDAIFHQPGWQELPRAVFRERVAEVVARRGWVVDGNYSVVRDLVWAAADSVVWLDPPRRTVMRRVIARTAARTVTREELWNGNREPWTNLLSLDPQRSVVAWSWTRHRTYRERYGRAQDDPAWAEVEFIRVRRPREARLLLAAATPAD
jgi:adenylate kinase family enzyme